MLKTTFGLILVSLLSSTVVYSVAETEENVAGYTLAPPAEKSFGGYDAVYGFGYRPVEERDVPAGVTYIMGDTIRERGYGDLGEVIAEYAGVYVADIPGREGPQATPYIRGGDGEHILLLIDGVPVNNLKYGWNDLAVVPLESVDHVEIIRGPASARYGDRARAGVIAVYTMQGPRESARSQLSASDGTYDTERYRFNFGMTARDIDFFFGMNRLFGHEPNTFDRISGNNLDFRLGHRWGDGNSARLIWGNLARDVSVVGPNDWDDYESTSFQEEYHNRFVGGVDFKLGPGMLGLNGRYFGERRFFENRETRRWYSDNTREGGASLLYGIPHINDSFGTVEVSGVYREDLHREEGQYLLTARINEDLRVPKAPVNVGLGVSYDMLEGGEGAITPDLRIGLNLADWVKLYGSFAGGFKFPDIGTDLPVEKSRSIEGGAELYFTGLAQLRLGGYREITENATLSDTGETYETVRRIGGELEVHGRLPWPIFYYDLSYSYLDSDLAGTGADIPLIPRQWGFGRLGYKQSFLKDDLTICAELKGHYVGERELYRSAPTPDGGDDIYSITGPKRYLLGGFFSLTIVSVEIFVDIENIAGNQDWQERLDYNLPFRTRTYVGFQWTMFD
jgi:outer membrane receptor protein involved in Fe transport